MMISKIGAVSSARTFGMPMRLTTAQTIHGLDVNEQYLEKGSEEWLNNRLAKEHHIKGALLTDPLTADERKNLNQELIELAEDIFVQSKGKLS